jgi:hypothetical protein
MSMIFRFQFCTLPEFCISRGFLISGSPKTHRFQGCHQNQQGDRPRCTFRVPSTIPLRNDETLRYGKTGLVYDDAVPQSPSRWPQFHRPGSLGRATALALLLAPLSQQKGAASTRVWSVSNLILCQDVLHLRLRPIRTLAEPD